MITEQEYPNKIFYDLSCDNCGIILTDNEGDDLFEFKADAIRIADEKEWKSIPPDQHLCDKCKNESNNNVTQEMTEVTC